MDQNLRYHNSSCSGLKILVTILGWICWQFILTAEKQESCGDCEVEVGADAEYGEGDGHLVTIHHDGDVWDVCYWKGQQKMQIFFAQLTMVWQNKLK